jgi:hypothetical protein
MDNQPLNDAPERVPGIAYTLILMIYYAGRNDSLTKAGSTARQPLLPIAPTHRWQRPALMGAFGIHPPDEAFEEFSHLYIKDAVDRQHSVRPQNRQKGEAHYLEVAEKRSAGVFNHEEALLPCFASSHLLSSTWMKRKYRQ